MGLPVKTRLASIPIRLTRPSTYNKPRFLMYAPAAKQSMQRSQSGQVLASAHLMRMVLLMSRMQ